MLLAGLIVLVFLAVEAVVAHLRGQRLRACRTRIRESMRRMHFFAGLVLYLLLVVPWFVLIHLETDGQFTRTIFLRHMFSRAGILEVGRGFENNTHFWFYFARMLVDMFPWVIMLPGAVVQVFRPRCRDTWRSGAYLLVWTAVWLAFFSAMRYRKNEYILPMYPAAMVLAAKMLVDFIRDQASDVHLGRAIRLAFVAVAVGVTAAGAFALALLNRRFFDWVIPQFGTNKNDEAALRALADLLHGHLAVAALVLLLLVGAMIAAAVLVHRRRTGAALALLTGGTAVVMLLATHVLMDRIIDPRRSQRTFAAAVEAKAHELAAGTRLILFATEQHELVYLLPDRFDSVPGVKGAAGLKRLFALKSRLAAAENPTFVVMENRLWGLIVGTMRVQDLHDPYIDRLEPVTLPGWDEYARDHRKPLVLLRYRPEEPVEIEPAVQRRTSRASSMPPDD